MLMPWVCMEGNISFAELVEQAGNIPLPPYIKKTDGEDKERYQTIYAIMMDL